MASLNRAILIGHIGNDPEIRTIGNNDKVASFRLATTERYKDRNGDVKENTEWHQVTAWGKLADIVEKFVKKGRSCSGLSSSLSALSAGDSSCLADGAVFAFSFRPRSWMPSARISVV